MEPGKIGIFAGLGASILAILFYLVSLRGGRRALLLGRAAFVLTSAAAFLCFGRLMWLMVNHAFQHDYVFQYSSRELGEDTGFARFFLYAATWAGQDGSFLLWMFWTSAIGLLVAWKAGKWEARVMPLYTTILSFLFGILIWLEPYRMLLRSNQGGEYPVEFPWPPATGMGLHPSLQNYWMAIHPPTIFFGFSALAVPFCFAIAAMLWKEYDTWARRVMPWTLLASTTLGVGLMMGGYWAYETLGWHGFWAWDPVENASLFPWLGSLALLHGLVVQKHRGGMGRTTIFLSLAVWVLFLYGTFLTRSGVLSNFSVHSFASLKHSALTLLLVMIGLYGIGGLLLLIVRWRGIPGRPISDRVLSRDTAMVLAVTVMIGAMLFVTLGTSWPLLSQMKWVRDLTGLQQLQGMDQLQAVMPPFYNRVGSVLLIPGLIAMAVVPFLAWSKTNAEKFLWKILTPWFCALAGGFLLVYFVLTEASRGLVPPPEGELRLPGVAPALGFEPDTPRMLVVAIGTLGLFAAVANIMLAVKVLRAKSVTAGGWLSHVGIGLLFLGTIVSNVYEKTENFALLEGDPPVVTPFGYTIGFKGWTHDDKTSRLASISDPAEAAKLQEEIRADWFKFEHGVKMEMTPIVRGSGVARADEPVHSPDDGHGHAPGDGHDHEEAPKPIPAGPPFIAKAPVFNSQQLLTSQSETQTMRWPYIHKELFRDVYLAIANDPKLLRARATLKPGEEQPVIIEELGVDTGYRLKYREFFMQGHGGESGSVMGGKMLLTAPDKKTYRLSPAFELRADGGTSQAGTEIEGLPAGAAILDGGIDASTKQATVLFELPEFPARWFVPLQVTNKPMINLVWIGVILMGIGGILAMMRRSIEARKEALLVAAPSVGLAEDAPAQTVAGTNGKGAGNGAGAAAAARNRGRTKAGSRR